MPVVGCEDEDQIPTLDDLQNQNHASADDFSEIEETDIEIRVAE